MSRSDDHTPPAAPFSGDDTGAIFDAPDMVLQPPTTAERVVETQSGFLVVIRRMDGSRQALSVKRRLGTPPASSVFLTPDESVKLSRILADARDSVSTPASAGGTANPKVSIPDYYPATRASSKLVRNSLRGVVLALSLSAALIAATCLLVPSMRLPGQKIMVKPAEKGQLDNSRVETFVRDFVSNMLDFNPNTYKVSQIRAMAAMTPEVMESYWKETHFPVTRKQLSSLPQDTTVMLNKIASINKGNQANIDVWGNLVNEKTKIGYPLHLALEVIVEADGNLRVAGQKDLTANSR